MLLATLLLSGMVLSIEEARQPSSAQPGPRLRVFLDCGDGGCYEDYLREEVEIADYVRDRTDADVHVLVTRAETGARGAEYTLSFLGQGALSTISRTLKVTTESTDSEDSVRRRLASALTLGLLGFMAPDALPPGLTVSAEVGGGAAPADTTDPWNRWIFSLNGSGDLEAEESTEEHDWGFNLGIDRVTLEWKTSIGIEFNQSGESFTLDDGERLAVETRRRNVNGLLVKAAGEHWSYGGRGQVRSSTFDNMALDVVLAPAVEWNFFPYSMYTRRQLRVQYAAGPVFRRYYEVTLYGKLEETRATQEISATYEQREPWGTLEGRVVFSNFFPGLSTNRISVEGEATIRIARGFSVSVEGSASRIRDQLSLPRRDATPEEVLLRLRQLSSGFETNLRLGVTYQFGSRFASIVNPRFGQ